MNVIESKAVKGFITMANDGWNQGWHERNGGNLSYRMSDSDVSEVITELDHSTPFYPIGASVPGVAGEYFIFTGTGRYFQNVIKNPTESIGIIKLDDKGENYQIVWGLENGGRPTSEIPSHLMSHETKKAVSGGKHRVIYHAHPVNTIALTFVLPLTDEAFTREIWEMMPECSVVFPEGIGVAEWLVPGSRELAIRTGELLKSYNVAIWPHHGMLCSGEDFDSTFGLMHTVEKAASILVKVMSMSSTKRQTITSDNMRALAKDFKLSLDEKFLY
ncbi:MAG: rhamnulose-1-phosphate aldolase [Clostridia bacterium]|nr:rhamnulose-1-phosphate aldolase [Clostridia bacterium]